MSAVPQLARLYAVDYFSHRASNMVAWLLGLFLLLSTALASAVPIGFTPASSMLLGRYSQASVLLDTGKVLVVGGRDTGFNYTNSAELYEPSTNTWVATGAMGTARTEHAMAKLADGRALVVGGFVPNVQLKTAELYDPATGTWSAAASMAGGRVGATATTLANGKVLVVGGGSAEVYDPVANSWTATGAMTGAGGNYHTVTLLPNGKVLAAGGAGSGYVATAELYDPAANTWTATGSLITARGAHTATLLTNGKVLVAGGVSGNGSIYLSSAELYDPAAGTWSAAGSLAVQRDLHTATRLNDGTVLVVAGQKVVQPPDDSDDSPVTTLYTSAELYNPATDTWTAAGNLAAKRYKQVAELLPNGKVLIAVGVDNTIGALSSAQLFDPTPASVPGAPVIGAATAGNAQATVTFTAPVSNGGNAITGYTVISSPGGGVDSNAGSTGLSHVVTGLVSGTAYTFTVIATNGAGTGTASGATNSVTPVGAPAAPVISAATAGDAQATVTFTAPTNGGSAITGYTVTSIPAGGVDSNAGNIGLSHVITGLVNGTAYTFTVTATNGMGTGIASAASNTIRPAAPVVVAPPSPPAPTIPVLPVGIAGVSLQPIFNLTAGSGPALLSNIVTLVSNALNTPLTFLEQTASGSVVLSGLNGSKLSFLPLSYQGSDGRANGIYPLGNGQFAIVSNGVSVVIAPAVINLDQLVALLPGVNARLNDSGSISAISNGVTYIVQPDFAVQLRQGTGMAQLVAGSDGVLRFTDASGNSQLLAAAFLEPFTVRNILQGVNGSASLVIQQYGTAEIVFNGQAYILVPDLTLGSIPAERAGQTWWQEGPNRYRVVNTLLFPGTTQGFNVK